MSDSVCAEIRGKRSIDLQRDPPPDLVVEVEVSRRLLDREGIYAAMGVPEVWVCGSNRIQVLTLRPTGSYEAATESAAFLGCREAVRRAAVCQISIERKWERLGLG
jgi:Uma2 family endonuclease